MRSFLSVVEWMFDGGRCLQLDTLTQPRLTEGRDGGKAALFVVARASLALRTLSLAPFAWSLKLHRNRRWGR